MNVKRTEQRNSVQEGYPQHQEQNQDSDKLKIRATATTATLLPFEASNFTNTITTISTTSTITTNVSTSSLASTSVQNKCGPAEATAFSYQRTAKRCARSDSSNDQRQTAAIATAQSEADTQLRAAQQQQQQQQQQRPNQATAQTEAKQRATPTTTTQCEPPGCRETLLRLAKHKAQLRADFFKDIIDTGSVAHQKQQHQQKPKSKLKPKPKPAATQNQTVFQGDDGNNNNSRSSATKPIRPASRVQQLIAQFNSMIVKEQQEQAQHANQQPSAHAEMAALKPVASIANSDEGCTAGLSPYSSDNEEGGVGSIEKVAATHGKAKVARCASSDSALGLEVDDGCALDAAAAPIQRRMTLTVTDLPLRPALLPLAEPTALPDTQLPSPTSAAALVPSKVLLEERLVGIAQEPRNSITLPVAPMAGGSSSGGASSRRESTQSCVSELGGVRYVRTPSVVVSDYSDDITACGISMEEMEYFRLQRNRCYRRCSLDAGGGGGAGGGSGAGGGTGSTAGGKDGCDAHSDVSAASSCSNLYYCGSTISALDGGECLVNGVRVPLPRKSSHSSSDELSGEDEEDAQQQHQQQLQQQQQQQISELLAATQLSSSSGSGTKKVGSNKQSGDDCGVTILANLNLD